MNVRELIEKLSELDPNLEVKVTSGTGGLCYVSDVDTEVERDPYDGDGDQTIVRIS